MTTRDAATAWVIGAALLIAAAGCGTEPSEVVVDEPEEASSASPPSQAADPDLDPVGNVLDPEQLGACVEEFGVHEELIDRAPTSGLFGWVDGWHHFAPDAELSFEPSDYGVSEINSIPVVRLALGPARTVRGDDEPSMILAAREVDLMRDAQAAGADLYVGGVQGDTEYRSLFVVAVLDDAIAAIGHCSYAHVTGVVEGFAESRGETPATTFLGLVDGDISVAEFIAWDEGPPVEDPRDIEVWERLDPDQRVLDPEMTPPEVYETASGVSLFLDFEASEIEPGTLLCVRSELARSGCVDLASVGRFVHTFPAFIDVPLTLRLVEERPQDGTQTDLARVAELSPDLLHDVAASWMTDEPLVIWVTGLDDGGAEVGIDTMPLADAEDIVHRESGV